MENKYICGRCGFPKSGMMGNIKTQIGDMAIQGIDVEAMKEHYLEHHPHQYKDLLKQIQSMK